MLVRYTHEYNIDIIFMSISHKYYVILYEYNMILYRDYIDFMKVDFFPVIISTEESVR